MLYPPIFTTRQSCSQRLSSRQRRASGGKWVTVVLAVAALVVVALLIVDGSVDSSGDRMKTLPDSESSGDPSSRHVPTRTPFVDATADSGIDFKQVHGEETRFYFPELIGSGGAFIDHDGDGDLDLYLVQGGQIGGDLDRYHNQLYENDGRGHFTNVSAGSGADIGGYGIGCAVADYDNDGDVDLYVTRMGTDALLRNDGDGVFADVSADAGISNDAFSTSASFFDYNRDGHQDIFVTNYVVWSVATDSRCYAKSGGRDYCAPGEFPPTVDKLYRNRGDGTFEDVTQNTGVASRRGNGLAVLCTDFNDDGWVDVYVANDQTPAHYWVNQKDGTFTEDAAVSGCAFNRDGVAIAGMGIAAEDFDSDGDYDMLVTNIRDQAHLCLKNEGGSFTDVTHEWGFGGWALPYTAFGVGVFDQDHDGVLDVLIANGAVMRIPEPFVPDRPYAMPNQFIQKNFATDRYEDISRDIGWPLSSIEVSRGLILGDYDSDGDVDVIVTNNLAAPQVLQNTTSGGSWTLLDLRFASRGPAINTRVQLSVDGRIFRREVRPGQGYVTSSDPRVHVGLADADRIDEIVILWPDGTKTTERGLPVNQELAFIQGGDNSAQ